MVGRFICPESAPYAYWRLETRNPGSDLRFQRLSRHPSPGKLAQRRVALAPDRLRWRPAAVRRIVCVPTAQPLSRVDPAALTAKAWVRLGRNVSERSKAPEHGKVCLRGGWMPALVLTLCFLGA